MSVILMGMDIPENCDNCNFRKYNNNTGNYVCSANDETISVNYSFCPLKSVDGLIEKIVEKYGHSTSLDCLETYHGCIEIIIEYCRMEEK